MSKLQQLTEEHLIIMTQVREEWIGRVSSGQKIDQKKTCELIGWLYGFCKLKIPKIIFVDSPLAMQYTANMLKANVRDNVGANVRDNVWDNVGANVWANVRANVRDNVGANVRDNVRDNVGANVWANVWDNVRDNVGANVRDNDKLEYFTSSYSGNIGDFGWVSFYDFFTRIGTLNNENFNKFKQLLECNIYDMIQLENVCIVCGLPEYIDRDDKGRMHSLERPAIAWQDGYGLYYVNGVNFEAEKWQQFTNGRLEAIDIMREKNQDKKRVMIMNYGNEKLLKELQAKEVSREKDACGFDMVIWVIDRKDDEPMVFYEGVDNSKNEKIYLRVPAEFKDKQPIEAKLWTFKPLWEEYQRTGVMFEFAKET